MVKLQDIKPTPSSEIRHLKAGEQVKFILVTDDFEEDHKHWINGRPNPCTGQGCIMCLRKQHVSKNWICLVAVLTDEPEQELVASRIGLPWSVLKTFQQQMTLHADDPEKVPPLLKAIWNVERTASPAGNAIYSTTPAGIADEDLMKEVAKLDPDGLTDIFKQLEEIDFG